MNSLHNRGSRTHVPEQEIDDREELQLRRRQNREICGETHSADLVILEQTEIHCLVVTPGDHAPGIPPNANEPKNTSTKSLRMSVRKAGEASSMCFFKEVKSTMATASYNTHSPFRRETSTASARNLDCHRTDCREQSNNTANEGKFANRQEKETSSNGAANISQTKLANGGHLNVLWYKPAMMTVSRKRIAPLAKGSLDPPHKNVWIAKKNTTHTPERER